MSEVCSKDNRAELVRRSPLNGLDDIEVADDHQTLILRFFHDAPGAGPDHLQITGGVVVRGFHILDVQILVSDDPDIPARLAVSLNRPGDASAYTLRVTGLDGIDPRYAAKKFRFFPERDDGLDCAETAEIAATPLAPPPLDYLAKDYTSFRQLMLDRLAVTMPQWRERHVPDIGIMLVELLAYAADRLSYYQDAVATEAYLGTARRRISIRRHVRLIDYVIHEGCNARALVQLNPVADGPVTPSLLGFTIGDHASRQNDAVQFLPLPVPGDRLDLRTGYAAMRLHCWGDAECLLPKGAVSATLVDPDPDNPPGLQPGDFLIFEVLVAGPDSAPDPDPLLRHPVRLTHVERSRDELLKTDLLLVGWAAEDAIPEAMPLDGQPNGPITIVRGNLLLADHGRIVTDGDWAGGKPIAPVIGPGRRRGIALSQADVNFAEPVGNADSAQRILNQRDPRAALPQIARLISWPARDPGEAPAIRAHEAPGTVWEIRADLIESGADDPQATLEIDDDGIAYLRFGDGECGLDPAGQEFEIHYRVGNGPAGNIGADQIMRITSKQPLSVDLAEIRNPLPAGGGQLPEDVEKVRILAPFIFRDTPMRAITAADYAGLVTRVAPAVQRATASLLPSEGRQLVRIAIDPLGTDAPDGGALENQVAATLAPYRRIGHDILVVRGLYVPLLLVLRVRLQDGYYQAHLRAALRIALGNGVLANGSLAPFHPDRLSFGTPIYGSRLIAAAQGLDGVAEVTIVTLARMFDTERGIYAGGVLRMAWNEIPQLDNDPLRPDQGRLLLQLSGGIS